MMLVTVAMLPAGPIRASQMEAALAIGSKGSGPEVMEADASSESGCLGSHCVRGSGGAAGGEARQGGVILIAFSVAPSGGGSDSVGDAVADAVRVVRESGLPHETTSMFTTIEADDWDHGMEVVKHAVAAAQAHAARVSLVLKADIRPGHLGQLTAKVERVDRLLEGLTAPCRG